MDAHEKVTDSAIDARILSPEAKIGDVALRPKTLADFVGQHSLKENLSTFINAAKHRKEALDHVIFYGPPGLGKTTLSQVIANELATKIRITSGPILAKTGDLAAILTNLQHNDVLFIDEIHRLNSAVEELLYSAMEDFAIDLVVGEGPAARTIRLNIAPFTLIGATTRLGLLTNPLKDRFGITMRIDFYTPEELTKIVERYATILGETVDKNAAVEISKRARGTPRIAIRLLKRVRDFLHCTNLQRMTHDFVCEALSRLSIDNMGLDELDYKYINYIYQNYNGGPVGIDTITAGLIEDKNTIEDIVEPYLIKIGFVNRTHRGRVLTENCMKHVHLNSSS